MKKMLPVLVGFVGALLISGSAGAAFTGIKLVKKPTVPPDNPRLRAWSLFLTFDDPTDKILSLNGLIVGLGQPQLFFRTNVTRGFHQEQLFGSDRDFAVTAGELAFQPSMGNDTYYNAGLKSGQSTASGIASGAAADLSATTPTAINFGWNGGGNQLSSNPVTGGAFTMSLFPAGNDQNISGTT